MRTTVSILILILSSTLATAGTLHVPDPYPTLADAIAAANSCDTILLAPGTYSGPGFQNLVLDNRCLTISSASGHDSSTLDLGGAPFILVTNSTTPSEETITLRDLTLSNSSVEYGAGASIDIINCRFIGSAVYDALPSGNGLIDSCIFQQSTIALEDSVHQTISSSLFLSAGWAGIHCQDASGATIVGNIFAYNHDGIYAYITRGFVVERNVFIGNQSGISDELWTVDVDLNDNLFWDNGQNFSYFRLPPDATGNIYDQDPRFCNLPETARSVMADSPLLPEINGRALIGNVTLACRCGDIDSSGHLDPNIADLTYLIGFLFRGGPAPASLASSDLNGSGGGASSIDIADVTYLVAFLFRAGLSPVC